jgi:hypothetical protein
MKEFKYFLPKKLILCKFSKIRPRMFIPDLGPWIWIFSIPNTESGSRIQGSKKHRLPDPDPQHCTQHIFFKIILSKKRTKMCCDRTTVSSPFLAEGSSTNANCRCTYKHKILTFACELSVVFAAGLVRAHHAHYVLSVLVLQECRLSQNVAWACHSEISTQRYCKT